MNAVLQQQFPEFSQREKIRPMEGVFKAVWMVFARLARGGLLPYSVAVNKADR
jgi:hypothetical protein